MNYEKKRNNQEKNTYVREHITEALLDLMKTKKLPDITVCELTEAAQIGRASFYRNYTSKEDILRKHIDKITYDFVMSQKFRYHSGRFREYTVMLFEHLARHRGLCQLLLDNNLLYMIGDIFDEYFLKIADDVAEQYSRMYLSGGFFNLFKFWLMRGCKETPEELSSMISDYMREGYIRKAVSK